MKEITEEEAREFIALSAGWKKTDGLWFEPASRQGAFLIRKGASVPDYFNDADREALFWMHQAEKHVPCAAYVDALKLICAKYSEFANIHANASERARAFLAVHGYKLKETK